MRRRRDRRVPVAPTPAFTASPSAEADAGILAEIPVDGSPCFVAEAGNRVWVSAFDGDELLEIDPETNELVGEHRVRGGPCGMFVHDGTLWIETGTGLAAFDPTRAEETDRIRSRAGSSGSRTPRRDSGASPARGAAAPDRPRHARGGRVEVDGPLFGLTFARGQLWLGTRDGLVRIDPRTRSVVEIELDRFEPQGLAPDGDVLWISSGIEGSVMRFDLGRRERDRLEVADSSSLFGGVVIGDSYWVAGNDGTIFQLDAGSGDIVDQIDLVGFGPMPADGDLWTVDFISNSVFRLDERAD